MKNALRRTETVPDALFIPPVMRRKSKHTAESSATSPKGRGLDRRRKIDIIGILMLVAAALVFLAIISHSHADESIADIGIGEFFRLFGGDPEIQARADTASNWLGLFGALLANFFINVTIGYLSISFPVLLGWWGWNILRRKDLRVLAYYTNYALLLVLLFSTFFGLLRLVTWLPDLSLAWSGTIGDFLAGLLSRLIGVAGGVILIVATIVILAVIVVDFDIQHTLDRLRNLGQRLYELIGSRFSERLIRNRGLDTPVPAYAGPDPQDHEAEELPPPPASARKRGESRGYTLNAEEVFGKTTVTRVSIARPDAGGAESTIAETGQMPLSPRIVGPALGGAITGGLTPTVPTLSAAVQGAMSTSPDAPVRSNGTIPLESVPGLGRVGMSSAAEDVKSSGIGTESSRNEAVFRGSPSVERTVSGGRTDASTTPGALSPAKGEGSKHASETGAGHVQDEAASPAPAAAPLSQEFINEHEKKAVRQAVARTMADGARLLDADSINREHAQKKLAYRAPTPELLDDRRSGRTVSDRELTIKADLVREKLAVFGIGIESISVTPGPVVTLFELVPDSSVKISKIVSLSDDLALALAARGIRIIAPIPGKSAVGIEIPNNTPETVGFRSVVTSEVFTKSKSHLPLGLGKSITGEVCCDDLSKMPHLLIAGATGSGKSVGINVMIASLLYRLHPSRVKFVMIDPKKIELAQYRGLVRHFLAACPDIDETIITDPANAVVVLKSLELEMDLRYTKLAKAGVRHLNDYNEKVRQGKVRDSEGLTHFEMPFIVVIIDELADLMITAAREIEEPIARLAQLARAVGIHLVLATQRPSVDVITGVIKANFPARLAYQVASRIDSRTILDGPGADQLLGNGDMLFLPGGHPKALRIQNAYLSTEEVERLVEHIEAQPGYNGPYRLPSVRAVQKGKSRDGGDDTDELLVEAARLVVRHQQGSVSLLQRKLSIGYSRAARIVDQLELAGIVGPLAGSKGRQVLVESEMDLDMMFPDE